MFRYLMMILFVQLSHSGLVFRLLYSIVRCLSLIYYLQHLIYNCLGLKPLMILSAIRLLLLPLLLLLLL